MTNKEKAIAIACRTFLSEDNTSDQHMNDLYDMLLNAPEDEDASDFVTVWEPFDQFTVDRLIECIDNLVNDILSTYEMSW
jgi:hypothetical protein